MQIPATTIKLEGVPPHLSVTMIATVGSNPLPVVLLALHCHVERVHLIYTPAVSTVNGRIKRLLNNRKIETEEHELLEDRSLTKLVEQIKSFKLPSDAILNYTAGTKHMSVATHEAWKGASKDGKAAYLKGNQIIWDAAAPEALTVDICLDEILELHFDQTSKGQASETEISIALAIQKYIKNKDWKTYKQLLPPLHSTTKIEKLQVEGRTFSDVLINFGADITKNFKIGQAFGDFCPLHWLQEVKPEGVGTVQDLPEYSPERPKLVQKLIRLLYSEWLEIWLFHYLRELDLFDEIRQGVHFSANTHDAPEIDVLASKGHRLFLFSCTTDDTPGLVKSKAFEAFQRSRRLGGDQASYAVVSFADNETLEKTITTVDDERWEGSNLFRAFGLQHVIGKSGRCKGGQNCIMTLEEALRDWLL